MPANLLVPASQMTSSRFRRAASFAGWPAATSSAAETVITWTFGARLVRHTAALTCPPAGTLTQLLRTAGAAP